jgi:hypothetical protein
MLARHPYRSIVSVLYYTKQYVDQSLIFFEDIPSISLGTYIFVCHLTFQVLASVRLLLPVVGNLVVRPRSVLQLHNVCTQFRDSGQIFEKLKRGTHMNNSLFFPKKGEQAKNDRD